MSCDPDNLLYLSLCCLLSCSALLSASWYYLVQVQTHASTTQLCKQSALSYLSIEAKLPLNMLILIITQLERALCALLFMNYYFTSSLHTSHPFIKINIPCKPMINVITNDLITSTHIVTNTFKWQIQNIFAFHSHSLLSADKSFSFYLCPIGRRWEQLKINENVSFNNSDVCIKHVCLWYSPIHHFSDEWCGVWPVWCTV